MREKKEARSNGKEKTQGSVIKTGSRLKLASERKGFFSRFFKSQVNPTSTLKREEYEQELESSLPTISPVMESALGDKKNGKEKEIPLFSASKNKLSVHLDSLIKIDKHIELWKKTLVYEVIDGNSDAKINQLQKYPWHTGASLLTLQTSRWLTSQHELQKQQIQSLRIIYDELLEPVFQQYLLSVESEMEQDQAQQFCNYLRRCIEQIMSNTLFEENPPLLHSSFKDNKGQLFTDGIVFSDEHLEQIVRAKVQVQPLRFTEAQAFCPPFDVILPFICSKLDSDQYHYHLNELMDKTVSTGMVYRYNQERVSALRLDLEKGIAPENYTSLSSLLPPNKQFQQAVITKLVGYLHAHMTPNHPRCIGEESDLFIPLNGLLIQSLTRKISAFVKEHKKLQPGTETLSSRFIEAMSTNLVKQLAAELLSEQFIEPTSRPLSHNFAM
ncbi:hypothetical protein [Legionella maioricensis]|uniref:Uncharacterized protein n=1 Tax=Legionella maioricensis TaxID=2896528 RepID=A0A9X2CY39_9GAMM|nr:hypothetical protein [Legionella maioricensis]MCL9682653.1 hypothetical protein [Legionella maioricensis]MCL9687300.1 hypothetical protein [Legionella maioricensis]